VPCCQTNPARATTGATGAARRGRRVARSRLQSLRQRRLFLPGHMFLKCDGRIGPRRPVVVRYRSCLAMPTRRCELRRGNSSNTRCSTQDLQQSMGEGAIRAHIEGGSLYVSHPPWPSGAGIGTNSPARRHQVAEPALYTVEGRQTANLRRKCGSVLIRKAKNRRAIAWQAVPFFAGAADIPHPQPKGGGHASHFGR
jgi:hypothetical protein